MKRNVLVTLFTILTTVWMTQAAPETLAPVHELKKLSGKPELQEKASRKKPLKLTSTKEVAKYFDDEAMAEISENVDFEKQFLLVFAWRGSGQDTITSGLTQSKPEAITFLYTPGRTRDLRSHTRIFAVRSDMKWSVQ